MLPCHRNNGCEAAQQVLTNREKIQPLLQRAELVKCRARKIIFNAGINCSKDNEMFVEKLVVLLTQKGASNCILLLVTIISVAITKYIKKKTRKNGENRRNNICEN